MPKRKKHLIDLPGSTDTQGKEPEYLIYGNLKLFSQGHRDGFKGLPDTKSAHFSEKQEFESAASYLDGWRCGREKRNKQTNLSRQTLADKPAS